MSKEDRDAILQAAAKTLAGELYAAAGYCRTRSRISVENFDRELRSAVRKWNATHKNLNRRKEQ
jgi:hypothetical protein